MIQGDGTVLGHDNTLTGGQTIILHHVGGAKLIQGSLGLCNGRGYNGTGSGHGSFLHDLLSEGLGTFQLGGGGGGAENIKTRLTQRIGDTCDEGRLRANNDQVGVQFACQGGRGGRVVCINCVDGNILGDTGIAGGAVHLGYLRIAQKRTDNCVFAAAGAQYQNLHNI